jgi:hypothetical protein
VAEQPLLGHRRVASAFLRQADAFQSAGDDAVGFARDDALRRHRNGLQARRAEAVHRHARHGHGHAGADRREPRDVAAGGFLGRRTAEHHVLDLARLDSGALDRVPDHMAAQGRAMGHVERAAERLADRRAGGGYDDGLGHQLLHPSFSARPRESGHPVLGPGFPLARE